VTNVQTAIKELVEDMLYDRRRFCMLGISVNQEHDIYIGIETKLLPPVSA
jgi:hypothetical protein